MKRFRLISLLLLTGCAAPDHKVAVTPLDPPIAVAFAPDAWIRGVTQEDINYAKGALAQVRGAYEVKAPVISLGKKSVDGRESMIANTSLYYYEFERPFGGSWKLVRCGAYNAD